MSNKKRTAAVAGALLIAGAGGGAALAIGGAADAATGTSSYGETSGSNGHANETPLTGTTAAKVRAAALKKYPGATIVRVETDSDGVYEAHVTTTAGDDLIVQVGKDFAVTGTQTGGGHGGHGGGGRGGHGDHGNETPLTGTTAAKVKAAALKKYPGATVEQVTTDSDGVYEADLTTTAGDHVHVEIGKDFSVTATRTGGGHGDHDGGDTAG